MTSNEGDSHTVLMKHVPLSSSASSASSASTWTETRQRRSHEQEDACRSSLTRRGGRRGRLRRRGGGGRGGGRGRQLTPQQEQQQQQQQQHVMRRLIWLSLFLVSLANCDALGMPGAAGAASTENGYDSKLGGDAICWLSHSSSLSSSSSSSSYSYSYSTPSPPSSDGNFFVSPEEESGIGDETNATTTGIPFGSQLSPNFRVDENGLVMLKRCPDHLTLTVDAPVEFRDASFRARLQTTYNFTIRGTIDLSTLNFTRFVRDDQGHVILFSVLLCDAEKAGFCSPFVHERANAARKEDDDHDHDDHDHDDGQRQTTAPGDVHGGTHIHSKMIKWRIPEEQKTTSFQSFSFQVTVPVEVNEALGTYFAVGAAHFFLNDYDGGGDIDGDEDPMEALVRYDVANAATPSWIVIFQEEPHVQAVSSTVQTAVLVLTIICSLGMAFLIYETHKHQNNEIMRLSQGRFLELLAVAALFATAGCNMLNPKNDLFCQLWSPFIFIPCQLIYAILIGRVWRINKVISPLLAEYYMDENSSRVKKIVNFLLRGCERESKNGQLRRSVSNMGLLQVIAMWTLPQVFLQVLAVTLQPLKLEAELNAEQTRGRLVCDSGVPPLVSIYNYSLLLVIVTSLALIAVAQSGRKLPSLFNEMSDISAMSTVNITIIVMGFAIAGVADNPATPPDVRFIVTVSLVLSITLNSTLRIILPKLQRIWRGETVLVSKLLLDHRSTSSSPHDLGSSDNLLRNVTGFTPGDGAGQQHFLESLNWSDDESEETDHRGNPSTGHNKGDGKVEATTSATRDVEEEMEVNKEGNEEGDDDNGNTTTTHSLSPPPGLQPLEKPRFLQDWDSYPDTGTVTLEPTRAGGSVDAWHYKPQRKLSLIDDNDDDDDSRKDQPPKIPPRPKPNAIRASTIGSTPRQNSRKTVEFDKEAVDQKSSAKTMAHGVRRSHQKALESRSNSDLDHRHNSTFNPSMETHRVLISEQTSPSRKVLLPVIRLQHKLGHVSRKVVSGIKVTAEEWDSVRRLTRVLNWKFEQEVDFEWEIECPAPAASMDRISTV